MTIKKANPVCCECGREVFGFWKYPLLLDLVCSKACLRKQIAKVGKLVFGSQPTPLEYRRIYNKYGQLR